MLALFLAISTALALVIWAETGGLRAPRPNRAASAVPGSDSADEPDTRAGLPPDAAPPGTDLSDDAQILARLADLLTEPGPQVRTDLPTAAPMGLPTAAPVGLPTDLLRVADFAPGDLIELELDGPAPRPADIRFVPSPGPRGTLLLIEGAPLVLFEGTPPGQLGPASLRFRSLGAA